MHSLLRFCLLKMFYEIRNESPHTTLPTIQASAYNLGVNMNSSKVESLNELT